MGSLWSAAGFAYGRAGSLEGLWVGCEVTWTVVLVRVGCLEVGGLELTMVVFGIMIVGRGSSVDVGIVLSGVLWRLAMLPCY